MKRGEYGRHTRGEWKYNELVWAVLAVLDVSKRSGLPPLTVRALHTMTGGNYRSILNYLPKWVELGWITRRAPRRYQYFVKSVYTYSITPVGIPVAKTGIPITIILGPGSLSPFLFLLE